MVLTEFEGLAELKKPFAHDGPSGPEQSSREYNKIKTIKEGCHGKTGNRIY